MTGTNGAAPRSKSVIDFGEARPSALDVVPLGIAEALKARPQWVCWKYVRREQRDGRHKWTKVPVDPKSGRPAKSTDPRTWSDFAAAWGHFCGHNGVDGIGYVFSADDPFSGVDLDDCLDPATGEPLPWAREIIAQLDTYTETSPSGTGVKAFVSGKPPEGSRCRKGAIEVYSQGRYFAITGRRFDGTPADVRDRQEQLAALCSRLLGADSKPRAKTAPAGGIDLDDAALLATAKAAKNGGKFGALWSGDLAGAGSQSEADLSLCCMLAFWTRGDGGRVDQLFRQSGLMRPKWDELRGEQTYGKKTVAEALRLTTEFFGPRGAGGSGAKGAAEAPEPRTGYHVIISFFRRHYEPAFRRGTSAYSAKLRREVKASEACWAPPLELVEQLASAADAPADKHGVKRHALPFFFNTWSRVAWTDLLGALPDEETAEVVDGVAEEEFRLQLTAALTQLVSLGEEMRSHGKGVVQVERRSIVDWAARFARSGSWKSIRSYRLWTRLAPQAGGGLRLQVALRVEVFAQLNARELAKVTPTRFARLCSTYGVGQSLEDERPQGKRAVILDDAFLHGLLAGPEGPGGGNQAT